MASSPRSRSAERLVDIIIALHRNGSVNRRDLMQKFGITERTVYRDLQALSPIIDFPDYRTRRQRTLSAAARISALPLHAMP